MYNYKRASRMLNKISINSNIKPTTSSFLNTLPKTLKFIISVNTHTIVNCPIFMNSKDKVELLKHYRICFYCLRHRFNPIRPCNRDILICDVKRIKGYK